MSLRNGFSDYYGIEAGVSVKGVTFTRPYVQDNEISNCLFHNIHCGPAIMFSTIEKIRLLIEECMIANCSASTHGGGVAFYSISGEIIMNKVCGFLCNTHGFIGQYLYSAQNTASLSYVTLHRCGDKLPKGESNSPIYSAYGVMNQSFCNSSNCHVRNYCLFEGRSLQRYNVDYTTFSENTATVSYGM